MRRRIKQTADFCRWSLYLAIVLAAVFLLLCRLLITHLYFYQAQIETYLSESLLTNVAAEEARGVWDTLYPVIELEYLRIGQNPADPGLEADFVRAVPNYWQSLLRQTAIWEELSIADLNIRLIQNPDSSWVIAGISTNSTNGATPSSGAAQKLADMLFRSRSIDIQNLSLDYVFADGRNFNLKFSEVFAENESDFHRISLKGQVDGDENGIEGVLELSGPDYQFRNMQGVAYISLAGADMGNIFASLLEGYIDASADTPAVAQGEMWFEISPGAKVEMFGNIQVSGLNMDALDAPVSFDTEIWGERSQIGDWRFDFTDLNLSLADQELQNIKLSMQTEDEGIRLFSEQIALQDLAAKVVDLEVTPERLREALLALSPRGDLLSASLLLLDDSSGYRWLLEGNVEQAYVQSYGGVPRLENIKGYFLVNEEGGEFLIDAVDTSVHFDKLFEQKIFNSKLEGQVGWRIMHNTGELHVYSAAINSTDEYGAQGVSRFHLITPIKQGDFYSDFTLISGLQQGNAELWPRYLPTKSDESLIEWFNRSDISGTVPEIGFIYRGYIRDGSEYPKTIQLMGDLEQGELNFAPDWPRLTQISSRFGLSDRRFYTALTSGQLLEASIDSSNVEINIAEQSQIQLSSRASGDLNDLLDLLRQTPARVGVGDALDDLQFAGQAEVDFQLQQPLANEVDSDQVKIAAQADLSDVRLHIESLDLGFESISGPLYYDENGLQSDGFSAQFWGETVEGSIHTDGDTRVDLVSEIAMERLLERVYDPLLAKLSGSFRFESQLIIPRDRNQRVSFRLQSDSLGVLAELPEPLAKAEDEQRALDLEFAFVPDQGTGMDLHWGQSLAFAMNFDAQGDVLSATFGLSAESPESVPGKFLGNVVLEDMDYLEWQPLLVEGQSTEMSLTPEMTIQANNTWFSGLNLGSTTSSIKFNTGGIEVAFSSVFSEGIFLFDNLNQESKHVLLLDWLDIALIPGLADTDETGEEDALEGGPGSDIDPRTFPAVVLDIQSLRYGESDWGKWNFELRPHELGLSIANIYSTFAGSSIEAGGGSQIDWGYNGEEHLTEVDLALSLGDVGEIFELLGEPPAVSSQSGTLEAKVGWLGLPWKPTFGQISGEVDVLLNNGSFDAEADGDELLKLIGLFSIDNWGRRLKFDFSDLTADGTGYRSFRGNFGMQNGVVTTLSPVNISLTTGSLKFFGGMDLQQNLVDAQLVATLPVRNNLAWVTAAFMGIPAAAGVWLFGELFKDELDSMASITYLVTGDIDAPDIDVKSAVDARATDTDSGAEAEPTSL